MRLDTLTTPFKIIGAAAALLVVILFFPWYGTDAQGLGIEASASAWQAFGLIDIILFAIGVAVLTLVILRAQGEEPALPLPASTIITGLGALALLLVFYRFLDTPFDLDRRYGLFLGLLATAAIVVAGRLSMQEQGESFSDARNRVGRQVDDARTQAAETIGGDARRYEEMTQEELYDEAQRRDIEGRSEMSKEELISALRRGG